MKTSTKVLCTVVLFAAAKLTAQSVPEYINYQGLLKAADGSPLATGNYTLEFNIYDQANLGTKVWGPFLFDDNTGTDGHGLRVAIVNGSFNVIIGPKDTIGRSITNAFSGPNRFIEIRVNGGDPILPRQQFLSTAYALQSQQAQLADGLVLQVADALSPPGSIVAFAGSSNNLPAGWLLCDGREFSTNEYPRLYAAIGTAWGGSGGSFNLPDLRGMFLRGVNLARTDEYRDSDASSRTNSPGGNVGNNVGSLQVDALRTHNHRWADMSATNWTRDSKVWSWTNSFNTNLVMVMDHRITGDAGGGTEDDDFVVTHPDRLSMYTDPHSTIPQTLGETRPNNAYVNFIIKY